MRDRPRDPPAARLLAAFALLAAASCAAERDLDLYDDAACERLAASPDSVEVFAWLKDPYGGPKRFGRWSTDEGLALAHELTRRGAGRMTAVRVEPGPGPEPSRRAGGLVVALPEATERRLEVFRFYDKVVRDGGYRPRADRGQKYLFFAWEP